MMTVTIKNMSQSNVGESLVVADPRRWWRWPPRPPPSWSSGSTRRSSTSPFPTSAWPARTSAQLQSFADAYLLALGVAAVRRGARRPVRRSARPWSGWSCSSSARSGARLSTSAKLIAARMLLGVGAAVLIRSRCGRGRAVRGRGRTGRSRRWHLDDRRATVGADRGRVLLQHFGRGPSRRRPADHRPGPRRGPVLPPETVGPAGATGPGRHPSSPWWDACGDLRRDRGSNRG